VFKQSLQREVPHHEAYRQQVCVIAIVCVCMCVPHHKAYRQQVRVIAIVCVCVCVIAIVCVCLITKRTGSRCV